MDAETVTAPTAEVLPPPRPWEALPDGSYAIVELMGHTTLVGRVTEIERFGTKMMGIECLFAGQLLPVILQGGASVYRFTQCTPETAWKRQHTPDRAWSLPEPIQAIVPPKLLAAPEAVTDAAEGNAIDAMEGCIANGSCDHADTCRSVGHCMPF